VIAAYMLQLEVLDLCGGHITGVRGQRGGGGGHCKFAAACRGGGGAGVSWTCQVTALHQGVLL
jgi:hypothetical protein